MEASALQAPVTLTRQRSPIGLAVLRLRSDEQLVALVRCGHEEAFQVIHDRYRQRLFAYMRQMLPLRQDAEDALQEVFERAYASLLSGNRDLALRPWLYRIAHNRCVDHLRRPTPPPPESMVQIGPRALDPVSEADCREALRRLLIDVRRLPEQQRSALLMREMGGISYADVAQALGVTVPAVKSLLVRARVSLAAAGEARDTACEEIRAQLVTAHEGRVRPNPTARRHLRDCAGCREFRGNLRSVRRQLLALSPAAGPGAALARLLGGGSSTSAAAAAGAGATGVAGTGGVMACTGAAISGAGHVVTLLAATVVAAGGAGAIAHPIAAPHPRAVQAHADLARTPAAPAPSVLTVGPKAPQAQSPVTAASAPALAEAVAAPAQAPLTSAPHRHRTLLSTPAEVSDNSLAPIPDPAALAQPGGSAPDTTPPPSGSGTTPVTSMPGTPPSSTPPANGAQAPGSTNPGTPSQTGTGQAPTPAPGSTPPATTGQPQSATSPTPASARRECPEDRRIRLMTSLGRSSQLSSGPG